MKICHVINTLNRGGAETHLLDLIKEQKINGYSIDLIVIGPDNQNIISLDVEFLNIGIPIHRLKGPNLAIISYQSSMVIRLPRYRQARLRLLARGLLLAGHRV